MVEKKADDPAPVIIQQSPVIIQQSPTKTNLRTILIYALALASALALDDVIKTIFDAYDWSHTNRIVYKSIYFIILITGVVLLGYFTNARVAF